MAKRGKAVPLDHMFVADFETTDSEDLYMIDKDGNEIYNQRVWMAGFKNLETLKSTVFNNLDDFMTAIVSRGTNQNTEYAFHNLKFDGSYIVPWLFKNDYTVSTSKPHPGQFSILVDDRNNWYTITIQVTKRRKVLIWDSAKLFPRPLAYLHEVYGTPTKKLHEDQTFYTKPRPLGYIPDEEDHRYFENDLQVPAETLRRHIELHGIRFKKTQASQSFYNFEQMFKAWKFRFPALGNELDDFIRQAYWGGISYVPKDKAGKDHYDIGVEDINSSYPDKAANKKLPYGPVLKEFGEGEHPDMSKFWITDALVSFKLKPHCLPCIPSKSITEGKPLEFDKWMLDSGNGGQNIVRMKFSSIDYDTINMSYDFHIHRFMGTVHWAQKIHREIAKFVNHNNTIKVNASKQAKVETDPDKVNELLAQRYSAKTDNNSFYGKFGEEVIKHGKTPYYEDEDITWLTDREEEQSERSRKFLPVAIAITAWGRQQLVIAANILGEDFLYCDTDSIHYLMSGAYKLDKAEQDGLIQRDTEKLGCWSFEAHVKRGRFLRAKCYMEELQDGTVEATVAGLPADKGSGAFSKSRSCLSWDNFHIGHIVPPEQSNKLRTIRTATGNKLVPTGFIIREKEFVLNNIYTRKELEAFEYDPIADGVKMHGYIKTQSEGDRYYSEYKRLDRSTIMKYFRKDGLPIDHFADEIGIDLNDLFEKLEYA